MVGTRVPHHIHRIQSVLNALNLLAQQMPQHRDPGVGGPKILKRVHGNRALALLRLEIVGLALAILVFLIRAEPGRMS